MKQNFSTQRCWSDATLTVYQGIPRKNVCILSTVHTGVALLVGRRQSQNLWCTILTGNTASVLDQKVMPYSIKGCTRRWPVAVSSSTWLGSMPASYSRSSSSRRARRKVLQHLTEELREEYMEGKGATAVGTRWPAAEPTIAAAADTEVVLVRKSCKRNQASDRMPQAHVW